MISWLGGEGEEEGNFRLAEPLDWLGFSILRTGIFCQDKKLKQGSVYIQSIMKIWHIK